MKILLTAFFLFLSYCLFSQSKKLDSLLAVNAAYTKEDSLKVIYLTNVFRQYCREDDMTRMEEFSAKAIAIAKKLAQTYSLAYVYERLGRCYHGQSKWLQAVTAYNDGIAAAKLSNDKEEMAGLYLNLSALYGSIPDYAKSLESVEMAVTLYNEIGAKAEIGGCYMNIGSIYNSMQNPVKAVEYVNKALPLFKADNDGLNYGACLAYQYLSNSYLIASDSDLAKLGVKPAERYQQCLNHLRSAIHIAERSQDASPQLSSLNNDIGTIYGKMGNKPLALQYFQAAMRIADSTKDETDRAVALHSLGNFYLGNNDFTSARTYLLRGLEVSKASGLLEMQQNALQQLSTVFEKTKQFDSAYIYYQRFISIKDTIFNQKKEQEITRKQLQVDFTIRENDYKLSQQVTEDKLQQQALLAKFLVVAILLVLGIAALIFYNQRKTARLNNIINQQKTELEQMGKVKDKIFSVVSHDMRAPVNSLLSFIDLLEHGNIAPGKLAVYATELKQNLSHTSSAMNNLLNWAASQMEGFNPSKENVDISAIVTEMTALSQQHLQQKQVTVQNTIPAGTFIQADPNMMAAILRNLISNAAKYSYTGTVVTIACESQHNGFSLFVRDEGTGMPSDTLALFNSTTPQQMGSRRGTDNEKGTGLGLLLCKTFAEQMGGKIMATNNEKGMTFTLWLPGNK